MRTLKRWIYLSSLAAVCAVIALLLLHMEGYVV